MEYSMNKIEKKSLNGKGSLLSEGKHFAEIIYALDHTQENKTSSTFGENKDPAYQPPFRLTGWIQITNEMPVNEKYEIVGKSFTLRTSGNNDFKILISKFENNKHYIASQV